jgi:hypothetical protein
MRAWSSLCSGVTESEDLGFPRMGSFGKPGLLTFMVLRLSQRASQTTKVIQLGPHHELCLHPLL